MTSKESKGKKMKMFDVREFKTNVPQFDTENEMLFKASLILERMGNNPGLTAEEFYTQLSLSSFPTEDFSRLTLAAIAIETMMGADLYHETLSEPTIH